MPLDAQPPQLPAPGMSALDQTEGRHLLDYVRVLYKRRRIAMATIVLVLAAVGVVTYRAEPIYEASVQVLIEPESRNVVLFKEVIEQGDADKDYQQTQYRILESRSLARRTIDKLQLWERPELGYVSAQEPESDALRSAWIKVRALAARATGGAIPAMAAPSAPAEGESGDEARMIDVFLSRLTVVPVRNSRLVDVRMRSRDPQLAADMANALAQNYMDQNMETKLGTSKQASDWLAQQLESQRKQVEAAEVALQRYRERNDALSLDEPNNIVLQKLTDLNTAVTQAKTARIEKEALLRHAQSVKDDPAALNSVATILGNAYIQQLRADIADLQKQQLQQAERLGDRHPEMVKLRATLDLASQKLRAEVDRVLLSLQSQYEAALEQEKSLVAALDVQKSEALALNRKAIDYGALQREAISARQIFETLLQRTRETGISGELRANNIQIIDPADIPRSPVWPQKRRNLLLALLAGAALAIALAFFVDYLDNRIKSPDEIRATLGLPLLGLVPVVALKSLNGHSLLINNGVPPKFAEAIRAVRTKVLLAVDDGPRALVVTSTGPKEGKTVVATNLAVALAQAGLRVILVDADLRRPRVHEIFDQPQTPGVTDLLAGKADGAQVFRKTEIAGLSLLPAGVTTANPADLLGSPRFRESLQMMKRHFDWVIIDSPPVLAVTDAAVIAHQASGVLFVVGADRTSRHAAQAALEQLEAARAPFLGGVLNAVNLDRDAYYFAKYYRHEYGAYYTPNMGRS